MHFLFLGIKNNYLFALVVYCQINKEHQFKAISGLQNFIIFFFWVCVPFGLIVAQLSKYTLRKSPKIPLFAVKLNLFVLIPTEVVANRSSKRSFLPTSTFFANLQNLYDKAILSQRWGKRLFCVLNCLFFNTKIQVIHSTVTDEPVWLNKNCSCSRLQCIKSVKKCTVKEWKMFRSLRTMLTW